MKALLRNLVLSELKRLAKRRLKKFKGKIIAVTGSVGKTTTKDAIFTVLNSQFRVKHTKKSMNSDFGLPLTILEIDSGFSSAIKWSWLLLKGFFHSFARDHSEIMLFELGVDKSGDMDDLLSLVKPDIAVFTRVCEVHLEEDQFKNVEDIFCEKRKLIDALDKRGMAILNKDDEMVARLAKERGKRGVTTYSLLDQEADYFVSGIEESAKGLRFLAHFGPDEKKEILEVFVPIIGVINIYAILPAIICARYLGMSTEMIAQSLKRFSLPPGRMNLIEGKNGSLIIDSTYNASPKSMEEALKILAGFNSRQVGGGAGGGGGRSGGGGAGGGRRIAVLGNMNELGVKSELLHKKIGAFAAGCADLIVTVGKDAKLYADGAIENGFNESRIFCCGFYNEAVGFLRDKIGEGDVILVKGSQNRVRLEKLVKEIMAFPEEAKNLLVRQEKIWKYKI